MAFELANGSSGGTVAYAAMRVLLFFRSGLASTSELRKKNLYCPGFGVSPA
jgi:hypothetical protein